VDEIGHHGGGLADHGELAVQRANPLLQLVLVLEPGIEAFEVGPVPEHVRLLLHGHAARHPVLNQEPVADQLQDRSPVARRPPLLGKAARQRLDHVEHRRDLAFVAAERGALRERVGDHEQALGR
jgi:hypothetical protein